MSNVRGILFALSIIAGTFLIVFGIKYASGTLGWQEAPTWKYTILADDLLSPESLKHKPLVAALKDGKLTNDEYEQIQTSDRKKRDSMEEQIKEGMKTLVKTGIVQ